MGLLILALAPVFFILGYIYLKDKYEHEPFRLLFKAFFFGGLTVVPIIFLESFLEGYMDQMSETFKPAYDAFVVAGFSEELFKYIVFIWFIYKNKNFNEYFDGIVYGVFISLGFAAVENVSYVFQYGTSTGILRAFTSVPGHALFGVAMGYYFSYAKFNHDNATSYKLYALLVPLLLHGIYDYILFSGYNALSIVFIIYLIYLWRSGFKRLRELSEKSQFKETNNY